MNDNFFKGVCCALPIIISYSLIGFAAGALNAIMGLSILEVALLSLILFAGSAQFVFASLYTGNPFALIYTIFLLNFRHFLYAMSFLQLVKNLPLYKRIAIGAGLTDETFVLASSLRKEPFKKAHWMLGLNLASYITWFTGNVFGAWVGVSNVLSNFQGLDFALAAMFASILAMQWTSSENKITINIVIISACVCILFLELFFPNPLNLLVSILISCSLGLFFNKEKKNKNGT